MNFWKADELTRRYPFIRIIWNSLWMIPIWLFGGLLGLCIAAQGGFKNAVRFWKVIFA